MNPLPLSMADDPDLRLSFPALQRAAKRARDVARQTNTCLVVEEHGQVRRIAPDELDRIADAWAGEAERRLEAYRAGKVAGVSEQDVFGHD